MVADCGSCITDALAARDEQRGFLQTQRLDVLVKLARLHGDVLRWVKEHARSLRIGERRLRALQRIDPPAQLPALEASLGWIGHVERWTGTDS